MPLSSVFLSLYQSFSSRSKTQRRRSGRRGASSMAPPFLILSFLLSIIATAQSLTLPLNPITKHHASSDPFKILNNLAASSLTRARRLRRPPHPNVTATATATATATTTPLSAHSYGGYAISLSFGTPPQAINFIFDTGSSLVWFPCTSRYLCSRCNFPNLDPSKIPTFLPKLSSSTKLLGCQSPKCSWIFGSNVQSRCKDCNNSTSSCTQTCPPFIIQYGVGSTGGLLLTETLDFPQKKVPDFLVGCSIFSSRQPAGIAGFGRSSESLPMQMGLNKFSYCLVSRRFDDTPVSSSLVLDDGTGSGDAKTKGHSYTPFLKNPGTSNAAFQEYYYVLLRKVIVGDKPAKIPYKFLVPGPDGNGGTIVDSGSTFTFMERAAFEPVAEEFEKQMGKVRRATAVENQSGLRPCFNISGHELVSIPELTFQFKGGSKMKLPLENYISFVGDKNVACLMIVSDGANGPAVSGGPAVILGNFQQQNYNLEFDLANDRFGFARQSCV